MSIFNSILFPVDFSDRCAQTARSVAAIARQFNSRVTLIHGIGDYEELYTPDAPSPDAWIARLRDAATGRIKHFGSPCLDEFVVERRVENGEASRVITDYATAHNFDLIAMPTHGMGVFRRFLLGSVTARVLHDCSIPVWTTVHGAAAGAETGCMRTIVCATSLDDIDDHTVRTAIRIARDAGAHLHLLHAIPMPVTVGADGTAYCGPENMQAIEDSAQRLMDEIQKTAGIAVDTHVETGSVLPVVNNAIEEYHADLLVIGRGHIQQTFGALRSDLAALVRESVCPVFSV